MILQVTFGFELSRLKKDSQKDHPREQEQGQEQELKDNTLLKLIDTAYLLSSQAKHYKGTAQTSKDFWNSTEVHRLLWLISWLMCSVSE